MKQLFILIVLLTTQICAQMKTNPYLPLSQPFNSAPWNYSGTEHVDALPQNTVDWLLLEVRGPINVQANTQPIICRSAVIVTSDGSILSANGDSTIQCGTVTGDYYLAIHQRNHLPIMTKTVVNFKSGYLQNNYNFYKPENVYGGAQSLVQLRDTLYGMVSGDVDNNGVVNVLDYGPVQNNLFKVGYYKGDVDNNGVVNVLDYAFVQKNLFRVSQLPTSYIP